MKKYKITLGLVAYFLFTILFNSSCNAAETVRFEGIGRYGVAIAGNNNAYYASSDHGNDYGLILQGSVAESGLDIKDWSSYEGNIPLDIRNRINNMSGSWLRFNGNVVKSFLTTFDCKTNIGTYFNSDILIVNASKGTYKVYHGSSQVVDVSDFVNQMGWYYVSILDADRQPHESWSITTIYENSTQSLKYIKFIEPNRNVSNGRNETIYFNSAYTIKKDATLFGVAIGGGYGGRPIQGLTEDRAYAVLEDGSLKKLYQQSYNGRTIFQGRYATEMGSSRNDFINGTFNTDRRPYMSAGGEMDIFNETLGRDFFGGKQIVGYRFYKDGSDGFVVMTLGLSIEIYYPDINITTDIIDSTPETIVMGETIHTSVTVTNRPISGENNIAYNTTIVSNLDSALSNATNIKVKYNGSDYTSIQAVYDSSYNRITLSNVPMMNPSDNIVIEYDAVVNSNIQSKVTSSNTVSLSTNSTVKSYPINLDNLSASDRTKYSNFSLNGSANDSTTGSLKAGGITINYIDKKNNNILETKNINGNIGENVSTSSINISGYVLEESPATENYTLTVASQTVNYYYLKQSNVITKFIDEITGERIENIDEVVVTYKEGDSYTTTPKEIDGYKLFTTPNNANGTIERDNIEVVYKYKKISLGVDVKYIDENTGDEIAKSEHIDGLENDDYTTEEKEIEGYELTYTPDNANGKMIEGKIEVIYSYSLIRGKIVVTKVDKNNNTKYLSGASFRIEKIDDLGNVDNSFKVEEKTTEDNGKVEFTDLPVGRYKITETKAPDGYELSKEAIDVEINSEQREINIVATDKLKLELPNTGGEGILFTTLLGINLILVAIIIKKYSMQK